MGTICLQCGDPGCNNAFIFCVKCLNFAVHRYCLDVIPETLDEFVYWLCDDCAEIEWKQSVVSEDNAKKSEKVFEESTEESYNASDERERFLQEDDSSSDGLMPLMEMMKRKKRKCSKLQDTVPKKNLHESSNQSHESDSEPQSKCKSNKGKKPRVKRPISPKQDTDPGKRNHPTCNGSLKSSKKKRILTSTGGVAQEQAYRISPAHPLLANQDAMESRNVDSTNDHLDKKESTPNNSFAEPVVLPIWRGSFNIRNKRHNILEGLVARMSSKACQKAYDAAAQFQPVLHLKKFPKSEIWPRSFDSSVPTGDSIALYFFPTDISECEFDHLMKEMVHKDLALKASVHNAELLIFTSTELPLIYWRFEGKNYLWGVFRGKQGSVSHS